MREFDKTDPELTERRSRLFQLSSGLKLLPDAFGCVLAQASSIVERQSHVGLANDICISFAELEGEGVDNTHQEILRRDH